MNSVTLTPGKEDYRIREAYKSLRTNIQFCGSDVKVIAVTSCQPNEGKSSVSMNLAMSLAEAGKRVILIDADLRKSVMIGRYKINKSIKGLSHLLSGQNTLEDVVCGTNFENLKIIFSGPVPPNPAELLGSRAFGELLKALRSMCDYVVIDTPPLGSVIDSAVISQNCDGVALVISANTDSYKFAQHVKEQLEKTGSRILGVVLNKVDMGERSFYGKYYGKYYGEYYGDESHSKKEGAGVK